MSKDKDKDSKEPQEVTDFNRELYSLFDSKNASASKIEKLTKMAVRSAKYYKNIVYCMEKFITRCVPEYKLTGLYVLDSICRASHSMKQKSSGSSFTGAEYVGRFEKNIEALFAEFCKVPEDKEKEKVKRVVEIWDRSGTFSSSVLDNIRKKYFPLLETKKADSNGESPSPPTSSKEPEQNETDKAASLISSLAASLAQNGAIPSPSHSSHYTSPSNSTSASISHNVTPTLSAGLFTPYPSSSGPSDPRMAKSASVAGTSPAPTASATAFMSGMADPSAALALQTLLATVSQVNAATGSTPQPSQSDQLYAYARQPQPTVPQPQTFQSELPPVLQQLQGFLSNSYQTPNNNSLASSTATTGVDSSAGNSRNIAAITTTTSFPPIPPPVLSTFGSGHGQSLMTGTGAGPSATGPMTHPLPPRPGVASVIGLAPAARDPRAKADPRHAAKENGVQIGPGSTTTHPPAQSRQPHALPPPPTTRWPIPQTPGTASSTLAGTTTGPTNGPRMPSAGPAPGPGQIPLPPPPHLSGMRSLMDSSMMSRPGMHPFLNSNPHQEGQGGDHSRTNSDQISPSPGASYMNGGFNSMQANGLGRGNAGPIDSRPKVGASGEGAPVATMITIEDDSSIGPDQIRVVSRTLWVGGTFIPTISEQELESIFTTKGSRIATLMVNHAKYNAFIKMVSRAHAEHCKTDLDRTQVHGETMKVGWGCGFGPRDCFDYTSGSSVIPLDRLTDTDRRWLSNSVVGGFGTVESIRGGVKILEPNIEPILGPDGREALPRKGGKFGTGGGGGTGGRGGSTMRGGDGDRGRGRGRGRGGGHVGGMDHQSFATGASGSNQFQLGKRGDHQSQEGGVVGGDLAHQWIQGPRNDGLQRETTEPRKKSRWE